MRRSRQRTAPGPSSRRADDRLWADSRPIATAANDRGCIKTQRADAPSNIELSESSVFDYFSLRKGKRTPETETALRFYTASTLKPVIALYPKQTFKPRSTRSVRLLNQLVRAQQQRLRDRDAERLRGLHVNYQIELGRLQDRQIGRLDAFEDSACIHARLAMHVRKIGSVTHQAASDD